MTNKKIVNATPLEYNGITFKSRLEVMVYKTLLQEGFIVLYEPTKFIIWEGFKPEVPFYNRDKKTKLLKLDDKKLINITYTPDFIVKKNETTAIIEAKGFENDCFYMKKKMFRKYLENYCNESGKHILYFEIFTKKQLMQAINIINDVSNK